MASGFFALLTANLKQAITKNTYFNMYIDAAVVTYVVTLLNRAKC